MDLSTFILARIQFAVAITFHIIFPSFSIGLAVYLVWLERKWLSTHDPLFRRTYQFWLHVFAMTFGMGVVSGIVMSFEIGLNFSRFAQMAGSVIGSFIGWEVVSAFFLEAGFFGIMLFGWGRVSERMHFFATCAVCLGTTISAGWIMAANSWMQTPAGYSLQNGRFIVESWRHAIFNPAYLYRFPHMLLASYLTAAFIAAAVGAWYLLKRRHLEFARLNLSVGIGAAGILIFCQIFLGDLLAGVVAEHQPSKIQAIEGNWDDASSAPYLLYIHPNQEEQRNKSSWGVPRLGSLLVTHSLDGTVPGLKRTPPAEQPRMGWVFYAFRTMFLLGTLMFIAAFAGAVLRLRGKLYSSPWYHRWLVAMAPVGTLATVGGWYTAEIGRQPWVIFGLLRTRESVSPVAASSVAVGLALLVTVYGTLLVTYLALLFRRIDIGPEENAVPALSPEQHVRRSRGMQFKTLGTP